MAAREGLAPLLPRHINKKVEVRPDYWPRVIQRDCQGAATLVFQRDCRGAATPAFFLCAACDEGAACA